ncbi:MAG: hypothetical protein M1816_003798 [Peltula sp. TS41687]|nr:MAG: hypothetical protein M1816_003798 [Peltula sp. TS41687]
MSASRGPVAPSVTVAAPMAPAATRSVPPRYRVAAVRVQTDAAAIATLPANRRAAARTALAAAAATVGSRVDRFTRHRRGEAGDRSQLSFGRPSASRSSSWPGLTRSSQPTALR